jgi:hypothetical protein
MRRGLRAVGGSSLSLQGYTGVSELRAQRRRCCRMLCPSLLRGSAETLALRLQLAGCGGCRSFLCRELRAGGFKLRPQRRGRSLRRVGAAFILVCCSSRRRQ